jgi:hypothetical protein
MGEKIFDMGKNQHVSKIEFFRLEPDPMMTAYMDRAKDAMDAMAYAMNVMSGTGYMRMRYMRMKRDSDPHNPGNMKSPNYDEKTASLLRDLYSGKTILRQPIRYGDNTGTVIDLKPEDYSVSDIPKELMGVVDVEDSGSNKQS